jgi:hypothetical protein
MTTTGSDPVRGLPVTVYRPAGTQDCTLNGASSRFARLTVIGIIDERVEGGRANAVPEPMPEGYQTTRPGEDAPAAYLRIRKGMSRGVTWYSLEPAYLDLPRQPWLMAGGNFAGTSDARWMALVGGSGIVAIHDRNEGQ